MKSTRAFRMVCVSGCISLASVTACNGQTSTSTSDNTGFGDDGGGGNGGSSGGSGGGVSSNGGNAGGSSSGSAPGFVDGGISCGFQGGCATSESCCYSTATGAGGLPAEPTCAASGSCSGSSLDCSSTAHCSGSQVCCFAFAPMDAGQQAAQPMEAGGPPGFGGFGGFGAPPPAQGFSAQCADQCPSGDMVHYQLCATSTECPSGQNCVRGQYTTYCAAAGMNGFPGGPGSDASMGAPSSD